MTFLTRRRELDTKFFSLRKSLIQQSPPRPTCTWCKYNAQFNLCPEKNNLYKHWFRLDEIPEYRILLSFSAYVVAFKGI